jgi:sirohydrochlorin cobaltochelatase
MSDRNEEYRVLKARLKTLLPAEYQGCYEDVKPTSMGSAGLKFASNGRVAWDEMWASFCDLALAGGPPHRGKLLEPATKAEIAAEADRYEQVVDEICRGIELVTGLYAEQSSIPGWVDVDCINRTMAGWLVRAINIENVSAHAAGTILKLPAGPRYRIEKEIKNVVTAIAKTSHYWCGHTSTAQHRAIAGLFEIMESESVLIQAPLSSRDTPDASFKDLRDKVAGQIHSSTGLEVTGRQYYGWLGVNCKDVPAAIWMMRAMVASNVLCRREDTQIFIPINPVSDHSGNRIVDLVWRAHDVAVAQGLLG